MFLRLFISFAVKCVILNIYLNSSTGLHLSPRFTYWKRRSSPMKGEMKKPKYPMHPPLHLHEVPGLFMNKDSPVSWQAFTAKRLGTIRVHGISSTKPNNAMSIGEVK